MVIPNTMKAAILTELKKPLIISEIKLPKSLNVGQVFVKIHYSGICGSQIGEIEGVKGNDKYLPHLLGHEGSGTVLAIGPGVKTVKPNDKIILHWRKGSVIESETPKYYWNNKIINAGWLTSFNEYAIVSENRCTAIPFDCDIKVAALFGCAILTGFGVVENNSNIRIGESVIVYGAGGIGLNIIQAASLKSAFPIIAIDKFDNRLKLAKLLGATHIINSTKQNVKKRIKQINNSQLIDIFIDNTGSSEIIEFGYKIIGSNGKLILVGVQNIKDNININTLSLHFGKILTGSHGGDSNPTKDIPRYMKMYKEGKFDLLNQITNITDLDNINKSINNLKNGKISGRCLIKL